MNTDRILNGLVCRTPAKDVVRGKRSWLTVCNLLRSKGATIRSAQIPSKVSSLSLQNIGRETLFWGIASESEFLIAGSRGAYTQTGYFDGSEHSIQLSFTHAIDQIEVGTTSAYLVYRDYRGNHPSGIGVFPSGRVFLEFIPALGPGEYTPLIPAEGTRIVYLSLDGQSEGDCPFSFKTRVRRTGICAMAQWVSGNTFKKASRKSNP